MSLLLDALKRAEAARHDTAPVLSLATDLPVAAPNDLPLPPLAEAQHSNDAQLTEARPVSLELTLAPLSEPLAAPSTAPASFAAGVTSTPAFSLTPVAAAETPKAVPSRPAEAEPLPPGHPLWGRPGVIVSPHVAGGGSAEVTKRVCELVAENARRFARGEPPRCPIGAAAT